VRPEGTESEDLNWPQEEKTQPGVSLQLPLPHPPLMEPDLNVDKENDDKEVVIVLEI
tara:strand:- start:271 stop:441 length:171 start_codon:yes stop_codon:yes gene_type:complete